MTDSASARCSRSALSRASDAGSSSVRRAASAAGASRGSCLDGSGSSAMTAPTVRARHFSGNAITLAAVPPVTRRSARRSAVELLSPFDHPARRRQQRLSEPLGRAPLGHDRQVAVLDRRHRPRRRRQPVLRLREQRLADPARIERGVDGPDHLDERPPPDEPPRQRALPLAKAGGKIGARPTRNPPLQLGGHQGRRQVREESHLLRQPGQTASGAARRERHDRYRTGQGRHAARIGLMSRGQFPQHGVKRRRQHLVERRGWREARQRKTIGAAQLCEMPLDIRAGVAHRKCEPAAVARRRASRTRRGCWIGPRCSGHVSYEGRLPLSPSIQRKYTTQARTRPGMYTPGHSLVDRPNPGVSPDGTTQVTACDCATS